MSHLTEAESNEIGTGSKKQEARRRILGWLGLGAAGAMALRILPIRFSKKLVQKKSNVSSGEDKKIFVKINKSAVKRARNQAVRG